MFVSKRDRKRVRSIAAREWNRINRARTKAGQKSYGSRGKSAWLKAKGIKSNGNGIVRGTQRMKRLKRKYGE